MPLGDLPTGQLVHRHPRNPNVLLRTLDCFPVWTRERSPVGSCKHVLRTSPIPFAEPKFLPVSGVRKRRGVAEKKFRIALRPFFGSELSGVQYTTVAACSFATRSHSRSLNASTNASITRRFSSSFISVSPLPRALRGNRKGWPPLSPRPLYHLRGAGIEF